MRTLAASISLAILATPAGCASNAQPSAPNVDAAPATGIAVGNVAPDFALTDSDGRTVRLGDFRGKVVLLEFSAMW